MKDLKTNLIGHLKQAGAYDVRIADSQRGFEYAEAGKLEDEALLCVEEKVSLRQPVWIHQAGVV